MTSFITSLWPCDCVAIVKKNTCTVTEVRLKSVVMAPVLYLVLISVGKFTDLPAYTLKPEQKPCCAFMKAYRNDNDDDDDMVAL